jgi:anti-sigma B factor antagonist
MKVSQNNQDGVSVLVIEGEIDLYASPQLREKFDEVVEGDGKAVVVNLDKVSYIDSSGLATFIEAYQKLNAKEGKLVLCNLKETVRSVFEIARLEDVLTLAGSESEAIELAK